MKLDLQNDNGYYINRKRHFTPTKVDHRIINSAFDFAYSMVFGEGYHRDYRSGGQHHRKKGELFANTFQGKLAEFIIFQDLSAHLTDLKAPDTSIHGKGIWDDTDLAYKGKKINIKSSAFFANLLLLESKDWNAHGEYIPNLKNTASQNYDYFIMVRIKPDIKYLLQKEKLFYADDISAVRLKEIILNKEWEYDYAGVCSDTTIKRIIQDNYFLPQNALLNGHIKIDADNYYIQSGDLKEFSCLVDELIKL